MTRVAPRDGLSRRRVLAAGLLAGMAAASGAPLPAVAQAAASEVQLKAAYLFKFGSFIEWPAAAFAAADSPLQIGVLEADALVEPLALAVAGRTLHGRSMLVRRLQRSELLTGLHVLFVGRGARARMAELLASLRRSPTLVVSESEGALEQGSMINFLVVEDKLRFEIAPRNAERGGLSISARLLAAAFRVETRST